MKVSVIIVTYNRKEELIECLMSILKQTYIPDEIIVIDNNSTDGTENIFKLKFTHTFIKYFKLDKNHGVAGGRNIGIKKASGDILVFIDDDAEIEPIDAIERIRKKFEYDQLVGILAFRIVNYYSKTIQREEFPHVDKSINPNLEFETTYFIGAGHAIRKNVFENCGFYPEYYFYGMEELDLSFRVLDKGYKIVYFPKVKIIHKKSPKGRLLNKEVWSYIFRNRIIISYRYLPLLNFIVSTIIWFLFTIIKSRSFSTAINGVIKFFKLKKTIKKEPIKKDTYMYIKHLRGRIWY